MSLSPLCKTPNAAIKVGAQTSPDSACAGAAAYRHPRSQRKREMNRNEKSPARANISGCQQLFAAAPRFAQTSNALVAPSRQGKKFKRHRSVVLTQTTFRHRDSDPGRSGESRVSEPARL